MKNIDHEDEHFHSPIEEWKYSRSGAWASRGFHFQHLISTLILLRQWAGLAPSGFLVPEGFEDCVVELGDSHLWLQIKSRSRGTFSKNEACKILDALDEKASSIVSTSPIKTAIALERPCDIDHVGSIENIFDGIDRTVVICSDPEKEVLQLVTTYLQIAEILSEGIVSDLYKLIADVSKENASLPYDQRRRISTTEVEHRIFSYLEAHDPTAIDLALSSGALEPVDFQKPIDELTFYQGVKVKPGHVVAGLVLDRPKDSSHVAHTLRHRRHVLISGPSGAGKSALMWLASHEMVGDFRWYQITARATAAHADAIVRFVRSRRPTEEAPIALAFDDVGVASGDLWNVLVRELRGIPSVYLLGSIRQEDVALVTNQSDTQLINVSLDKSLAENVWQKLRANGQTSWEHWFEPFEQSEGLMLEYVHILTQGQRLQIVVEEQIRQRQNEERHDELSIIRCTAAICASGAEIQVSNLCSLLNMNPDKANSALSRLIDEHLVKESRPGVLGGLHLLRSKALLVASHDEVVFLSKDSFWRGLPAATDETLPLAVQSIFVERVEEENTRNLQRLAKILGNSAKIETWVGILTGLGLAFLQWRVASFMRALELHGVQRAHWFLASIFSDPSINIPEMSQFEHWQNLRAAILDFRNMPANDLRAACLEHLPTEDTVPTCETLEQANRLLSCLVPICGSNSVKLAVSFGFDREDSYEIQQIADLLSTAYLIGPDEVEELLRLFGGEQVLFDRFHSQTPWVTRPAIDPHGSQGRTVRSNWYHVAEREQVDPHKAVCDICETLIALSPSSDAAASDAVDPQGRPITVGEFTPWSKNMPRENIPVKARVAWNVVFRQILLSRSAAYSLAAYTSQMAQLIKRTEKVFRSFTEKWIKGKSIANADILAIEINQIVEAVNDLSYAEPEKPSLEIATAARNKADSDDTLGALLTGVLGNLITRLSPNQDQGKIRAAAAFADTLAAQALDHEKSLIWRASSEPPLDELRALSNRLCDIAGILHEIAHDNGQPAIQKIRKAARKGQLGTTLGAAARHCRLLAKRRFQKRLRTLEEALNNAGWKGQCYSRQIDQTDGVYWPSREVAVLIEIEDFQTVAEYAQDALSLSQKHLGLDWRYKVSPVLNGYVLPALALLPSSHMSLPDPDFSNDWHALIDRPFLLSDVLDRFDEALAACTQISAILSCRNPKKMHPDEDQAFSQCLQSFKRNRDIVADAAKQANSETMIRANDFLIETWNNVVDEYHAVKAGRPVTSPLHTKTYEALTGKVNDYLTELIVIRILILQAESSRAKASAEVS